VRIAALLVLALAACGEAPQPPQAPGASPEWREFEGSWNASGSRRTVALGDGRTASLVDLRGSLLLGGPGRPGAGFRSELIGLGDTTTGFVGRSVWTDERGDQVYSELKGEGTAAKNRLAGTFLGGTGRYAGIAGQYEFSWQYVVEAEDGSIQGRALGLKGRFRLDKPTQGTPK
jgi:hypothetical protein